MTTEMKAAIFDEGPCAPCPAQFNMAAHTFAHAASHPDHIALEVLSAPGEVSECWTHGALADAVFRTAGGLAAHGIGHGDRVLLRLGNSSDFPIPVICCKKRGGQSNFLDQWFLRV